MANKFAILAISLLLHFDGITALRVAFFEGQKDVSVSLQFVQSNIITSFVTKRKPLCLVECISNDACFSTIFNSTSGECFLMNNTIDSADMTATQSVYLYTIKLSGYNETCVSTRCLIGLTCDPILSICKFQNLTTIKAYANVTKMLTPTIQTQLISNYSFNSTFKTTISALQMSHITTRPHFRYYLVNSNQENVLVYDENLQLLFKKNVTGAYGIKVVYDDVYVSSFFGSKIYRLDLSLNVIKVVNGCQINPCLSYPLYIEYDEYTDLVYATKSGFLYAFNRNLTLIRTINVPISSHNMKIRNGLIYAPNNSDIVVLKNNTVTKIFKNVSDCISSFYLLNDDYIIVATGSSYPASYRSLRVFYLNGTQISSYINSTAFPAIPMYLGIDPKGRAYVTLTGGINGFIVF